MIPIINEGDFMIMEYPTGRIVSRGGVFSGSANIFGENLTDENFVGYG
jgi:hypothetical protein